MFFPCVWHLLTISLMQIMLDLSCLLSVVQGKHDLYEPQVHVQPGVTTHSPTTSADPFKPCMLRAK